LCEQQFSFWLGKGFEVANRHLTGEGGDPLKTKEVAMTNPLRVGDLQDIIHRHIDPLPDYRNKGPNLPDRLQDAALGAFGIFLTQSPSFLASQRTLQHTKGHKNVHPLCGVEQLPCATQIRTLRDPITPSPLAPVCVEGCEGLEQHQVLAPFRGLGHQLLVALDGTNALSSTAMQCPTWLTRQLTHGPTLSDHAAITPGLVCPGPSPVLALPPEDSRPQDGHDTQDCARAAGNRWLATHAARVAPHGVTCLGDALASHQPLCALGLHTRGPCICTCKPDSHPQRSERWAFWQATDGRAEREGRRWHGRFTAVTLVRSLHDVLLRGGDEA
jgi:hypothetical protein